MLHLHSRRYPSGRRSGEIIRRICALQPTYSSDDTPQMQERGRLIRRDLVEALRGITRGSPFLVRLLSSLITVASISTSHRRAAIRSEEHTSELQSLMRISYAVFCLKKKIKYINLRRYNQSLQDLSLSNHT